MGPPKHNPVMGQGHPGQPNPPLTRSTLGQLCVSSHGSPGHRPAATQPGIEPRSVVTPLALRCSHLGGLFLTTLMENYYSKVLNCYPEMI
jgi:hypothetical protein